MKKQLISVIGILVILLSGCSNADDQQYSVEL